MEREVNNRSIIAVFLAQPERFEELLKEGLFDGALLKDIGGFSKPFSIWRISQCWEMLADPNDFIEIARPDVEDFKKRNDRIIEIFKKELGVNFTPIDYQSYHDDFYCADPNCTPEDILLIKSAHEMLNMGFRKIDIDLYCAVAKFNFGETKMLLEHGADPTVWLFDESGFQVDDYIRMESSLLDYNLQHFFPICKEGVIIERQDIHDLFGRAAYETMKLWIKKNVKEINNNDGFFE